MINGAQEVGFLLLQRQISLSAIRALLSIIVTYIILYDLILDVFYLSCHHPLQKLVDKICESFSLLHFDSQHVTIRNKKKNKNKYTCTYNVYCVRHIHVDNTLYMYMNGNMNIRGRKEEKYE